MRLIFALAAAVLAVAAVPVELPVELPAKLEDPALLNFTSDDEFEDYLDKWLAQEQSEGISYLSNDTSSFSARSGCSIRINGDLGHPQPVYLRGNRYATAQGTTGQIQLNRGEQITIACTGSGRTITHPQISRSVAVATATCESGALVSGAGWLNGHGNFANLACNSNAYHDAVGTNQRCWNNNLVIDVGFVVNGVMYPKYKSCFDQARMEVIYVWYDQTPENGIHQTGVDRPSWLAGSFFPGVAVNTQYTQVVQKATIAALVGQALADQYVTSHQFLARGHLAAKSDYVFATGQRSTFYFINAAPQWQPFNAGNWNWVEQNLRARIAAAGYNTVIYTGTFGVSQLRNQNNRLVDVYLAPPNRIPMPLYFYKVVYDQSRRRGTAFISINNPYYTLAEARALTFCRDVCRNNAAFSWLRWQPDRLDIGYSFCCEINDFRNTVPHLPWFDVQGILS